MAANTGFFPGWYASAYFPPVWFAPGDESAVPPDELQRQGGGDPVKVKVRPRKRPAWVVPAKFIRPRRTGADDAEALLMVGIL